jgi:hypothetical protein
MKNKIAIIADIIDSKKISSDKRKPVQNKINSILEDINIKYKNDIESKFVITLGDEFQGVLNSSKNLFKILDTIQLKLDSINLRFGIGIGEIYTEINPYAAIGADGPAYHKARICINELKKLKKKEQNILIEGDNKKLTNLFNLQLFWINDCFLNWSSLQKEVVKIKFFDDSITQSTIASKLKINQSLVSRTIKAAKYDKYMASEKAIIDLINMEYNL